MRLAHCIASVTDSTTNVVFAWQPKNEFDRTGQGLVVPRPAWDPPAEATGLFELTLDEVFGPTTPADLQVSVQLGNPAQALLELCSGAQTLVVGSRGHGGFASLLLGSVRAACPERNNCPVLVVHGPTPPPDLREDPS